MQDLLGGFIEPLSFPREAKLFLAPVDDENFKFPLDGTQLLTHRGLGDPVQAGGFGKALAFHQVGKDLKVFDVHTKKMKFSYREVASGKSV